MDAELERTPVDLDAVVVHPDYFAKDMDASTSAHSFNSEEIGRAPGGAGDINRVMTSMPGMAFTSDHLNDLVVRGGDPTENLTVWEHMELPNANHFGALDQTGGSIGMINPGLIREARLYTGGFPAEYGDKVSSVLDVRLREGSRDNPMSSVRLNARSLGGVIEGPLGRKASVLLSFERNYINLIKAPVVSTGPERNPGSALIGVPVASTGVPHHLTLQGRMAYHISPRHELSFVGIGGADHIYTEEAQEAKSDSAYASSRTKQYATGLNWKALWGERAYSLVTLSQVNQDYYMAVKDSTGGDPVYEDDSWERTANLKGELHYARDSRTSVTLGGSWKYATFRHDTWAEGWYYYDETSAETRPIPPLYRDLRDEATKWAGFMHVTWRPLRKLRVNEGLRYDYFGYTKQGGLNNRFAISYGLSRKTTLSLSTGSYYQTPTFDQLTRAPENRRLRNVSAQHDVGGIEYLFRDDLKITVEGYQKRYRFCPVSQDGSPYMLTSTGSRSVRGMDVFLHKRLTGRLYGLASYSLSSARVQELGRPEHDADYDSRHVFTLTSGVRLSKQWEASCRWRHMAGRPHDALLRSEIAQDSTLVPVYDTEKPNSERYPDYHRLDLRCGYRKSFETWNLSAYVEVENVCDRESIWKQLWSRGQGSIDPVEQRARSVMGGVAFEF
jgi:hypothetical protein